MTFRHCEGVIKDFTIGVKDMVIMDGIDPKGSVYVLVTFRLK